LVLTYFVYHTFNSNAINGLKHQEQNIEVITQEEALNTVTDANFSDRYSIKNNDSSPLDDKITPTKKDLSNDPFSSIEDSLTAKKSSSIKTTNAKSSFTSIVSSEKQKRDNSNLNQKKRNQGITSNDVFNTDTKNLNIADNHNSKSAQKTTTKEERSRLSNRNKEKVSDTLTKIEDVVLDISEEKIKDALEEVKKSKNSLTKKETRWSINPQLIISNYGAFNAKTSDNASTNYGLLLGLRITNNSFLRFGVRKLELMQTVDSISNNIRYLEFPLEVK
jgi:hypothetical protein